MSKQFQYLITVEPLGLLYGSAGRFLSPENLVGRSGSYFPPSAATVSGLFAHYQSQQIPQETPNRGASLHQALESLCLAGPFWGKTTEVHNPDRQRFYVPTPRLYLSKQGQIQHQLACYTNPNSDDAQTPFCWLDQHQESPIGKFDGASWVAIDEWETPSQVMTETPWKYIPHLHPRLASDQRRVISPDNDDATGSLFLENGVQMEPGTCLVYLSNAKLEPGWYRFGGEGHMVDVQCHPLGDPMQFLLNQPIQQICALIVPAVWGSNRLSQRWPTAWDKTLATALTARPTPFRYRLGGNPKKPKRLSRGRYAVPTGSIYVFKEPLGLSWQEWPDDWFPQEGPHMNRWGCGLALPLSEKFVQFAASTKVMPAAS
ncbi:MAG: type III-B CRISPR module-associated Cmr3 family protein [Cyanobacteria bacterium P01_A01_bin.123]